MLTAISTWPGIDLAISYITLSNLPETTPCWNINNWHMFLSLVKSSGLAQSRYMYLCCPLYCNIEKYISTLVNWKIGQSVFLEMPWSSVSMYSSFHLAFCPPINDRTYRYTLYFLSCCFQANSIFYIPDDQHSFMFTLMNVYLHFARRLVNVGITYINMYIYEYCVCIRTLRLRYIACINWINSP